MAFVARCLQSENKDPDISWHASQLKWIISVITTKIDRIANTKVKCVKLGVNGSTPCIENKDDATARGIKP